MLLCRSGIPSQLSDNGATVLVKGSQITGDAVRKLEVLVAEEWSGFVSHESRFADIW